MRRDLRSTSVRRGRATPWLGLLITSAWLAATGPGCGLKTEPTPVTPVMPDTVPQALPSAKNRDILREANESARWFHAKKSRPIWARKLEAAQTVKTLEGEEQVAAGHFLCRGEAGDIWPQTEQNLLKKYHPTDDVNQDGWRKFVPHPDAQGVLAIQFDHQFAVEAHWGRLSGKPGDFLVKNFADRSSHYPDDIWIVDQTLFRQTYEPVTDGAMNNGP